MDERRRLHPWVVALAALLFVGTGCAPEDVVLGEPWPSGGGWVDPYPPGELADTMPDGCCPWDGEPPDALDETDAPDSPPDGSACECIPPCAIDENPVPICDDAGDCHPSCAP